MSNNLQKQRFEFWNNVKFPIAVAHRGADGAGPDKESSLAAFKAAYKLGYRWFETDVVATCDKQLIISHGRGWQLRPNKDLPTRTRLGKMKYADIKHKVKVGGEPVIMLEELLEQFPDVKIFVDPKTFRSVSVLVDILSRRPKDIDRVCIGAFSKMRTIRTAYLVKKNTGKEVCTSILGPWNAYPIYLGARIKALRSFAKYYVQETRAKSVHVPYRWITNSPRAGHKFINYAHELNLKVVVFTPNSEKTIKASLDGGVDMIMSDRAKLLLRIADDFHKK